MAGSRVGRSSLPFIAALLASFSCTPAPVPAVATALAPPAPPSAAPMPAPAPARADDSERLRAIRVRLDREAERVIAFWSKHGPDREHGGFHGTLDRKGAPVPPTEKGVIQTSRHLWTFSMLAARRPNTPDARAFADSAYRFLVERFRDPKDGEFYFTLSRQGKPVNPKKQLYAESFAIYALSEYAAAFASIEAREHALRCFRSIDARAHDAVHGGYDQRKDPGWMSPGSEKETNTHIHLLEAFTSLFRLTRDPLVRARLEELARVTATKLLQPAGYVHKEFKLDFAPHGERVVSYGHDIETAWLLLDALDALGLSEDVALATAAVTMGANSARAGFDATNGGFFEEGLAGGAPNKLEKIWWVQAEALPGLFRLYQRTGDASYLEQLERTLSFIERYQSDAEFGGWYWGVTPDGKLGPRGDKKGEEWKASYHDTRALVFTSDWIAEHLSAGRTNGTSSRPPGPARVTP
jgi:mannobiose 2-epimerase